MQFINVHGFAPPQGLVMRRPSNALLDISSKLLMKESSSLWIAQKGFNAMLMQILQMDGMPLIVKNLPVSIPALDMSSCMWVVRSYGFQN
jgi:hypothetical protein